jgi:FAD binding domain in molybdopterin dehydrogenase
MHTFEFVRPADQTAAIATAAQSKTAQQGADVRFLGGGTTLIDLMKLNVETPARVLDINRLPLDKIEATSDGGAKIGAMVRKLRSGESRQDPKGLFGSLAGPPARRLGTDPQHGNRRRKLAAANALRLLPRHRSRVQQARAW